MNIQSVNRTTLLAARKFSISAVTNTAKPSSLIDSIIRVNHAGELGADRIYAGQMAILGNTKVAPLIQHMWNQEKVHKATFEKLLVKYRVRPTALTPIWNAAGYILGAGTALLGEKAAMACTVAVETVIVDHYNDQLRILMAEPEQNKELMETIQKFRDEEQEHHDSGVEHGAEQAPLYSILSEVIKFGCKQAIAISKGLLSQPNRSNFFISRHCSTSSNLSPKLKWDLYSAVCLERKPVILKPLSQLEQKVVKTLMELEHENSHKSDHEIKNEENIRRAELLKSGTHNLDVDLDGTLEQTAHEFEEISDKEFNEFKTASRITEADEKNDVRSLNRKLSSHLVLVINDKIGEKKQWILPHGIRKDSETMRETAERILNEKFGDSLKALFLGNAPCGFYKFKYPKHAQNSATGAKIFFFKALYTGGHIDTEKNPLDFHWATRTELRKLINHHNYFQKISMFLIDEDEEEEEVINSK